MINFRGYGHPRQPWFLLILRMHRVLDFPLPDDYQSLRVPQRPLVRWDIHLLWLQLLSDLLCVMTMLSIACLDDSNYGNQKAIIVDLKKVLALTTRKTLRDLLRHCISKCLSFMLMEHIMRGSSGSQAMNCVCRTNVYEIIKIFRDFLLLDVLCYWVLELPLQHFTIRWVGNIALGFAVLQASEVGGIGFNILILGFMLVAFVRLNHILGMFYLAHWLAQCCPFYMVMNLSKDAFLTRCLRYWYMVGIKILFVLLLYMWLVLHIIQVIKGGCVEYVV
ncbi:unnamed protein product [Taenia asiatica]|uniref:TLC domain-containing protein n=1 Tax=Taenia asiatica TaxID=60517 RepID=A0A0R3WG58_TAEAS|nr:unnamed protein product [Taenia asiatica]